MQKHHLYKPEPFWKYVLWTDEVQMELYGYNHNRNVWRTKVVAFHKKRTYFQQWWRISKEMSRICPISMWLYLQRKPLQKNSTCHPVGSIIIIDQIASLHLHFTCQHQQTRKREFEASLWFLQTLWYQHWTRPRNQKTNYNAYALIR